MSTILVAAAVVIESGRVLLTQRPRGSHLESLWEFPGGKVEPGEDPRAAVERELREEIGVAVRAGEPLEVTFFRYPTKDVLLLFFAATRLDPAQPVQDLGVAAHAWVTADELGRYPMPPADVPVLDRVRALLGS